MATVSISVPDELKIKMQELDEINWSSVVRKAIESRIKDIQEMKKIISKSKLTEKDAKEIGDIINVASSKRFLEMSKNANSN